MQTQRCCICQYLHVQMSTKKKRRKRKLGVSVPGAFSLDAARGLQAVTPACAWWIAVGGKTQQPVGTDRGYAPTYCEVLGPRIMGVAVTWEKEMEPKGVEAEPAASETQ